MHSRLQNVFGNYLVAVSKAQRKRDDEFRLTNFDIQEVSTVDTPANQSEWLAVKGMNMSTQALMEIIGQGNGDFVARLGKEAGSASKPAPSSENSSDQSEDTSASKGEEDTIEAFKLTAQKKADVMKGLGTVIKGLISVARHVEKAEVVEKGGDTIPEQLALVLQGSSDVIGRMLGNPNVQKSSEPPQNTSQMSRDLEGLSNLLEELKTTISSGDAASSEATSKEVEKALGALTEVVKRQGSELTLMRERVGLPAAATPDRVVKRNNEVFHWDLDMNRPVNQDPAHDFGRG